MPNRLLDVGQSWSPDPCLIGSASLIQEASYLTLSHCWGVLDQTMLTLDKEVAYQERIAISTLSTTVQDAIQVTRRLGVRYLWVDTLCIVQDSRPDQERESALMDLIYTNSLCIIASVDAEDASQIGLRRKSFYVRSPARSICTPRCPFPFTLTSFTMSMIIK